MKNMDKFVAAMEDAFWIANNIEGITEIRWNLEYVGTVEATNEIAGRINEVMQKAGMNLEYNKEGA